MKVTKRQLKQIIKEEFNAIRIDNPLSDHMTQNMQTLGLISNELDKLKPAEAMHADRVALLAGLRIFADVPEVDFGKLLTAIQDDKATIAAQDATQATQPAVSEGMENINSENVQLVMDIAIKFATQPEVALALAAGGVAAAMQAIREKMLAGAPAPVDASEEPTL